jgi:hypothetical protein
MVQARDDSSLALEPLASFKVGGEFRREDLNRHRPVQARVSGAVNLSHAPRTKGCENFIRSEFATQRQHDDLLAPLGIPHSGLDAALKDSAYPWMGRNKLESPASALGASLIGTSDYNPHPPNTLFVTSPARPSAEWAP